MLCASAGATFLTTYLCRFNEDPNNHPMACRFGRAKNCGKSRDSPGKTPGTSALPFPAFSLFTHMAKTGKSGTFQLDLSSACSKRKSRTPPNKTHLSLMLYKILHMTRNLYHTPSYSPCERPWLSDQNFDALRG